MFLPLSFFSSAPHRTCRLLLWSCLLLIVVGALGVDGFVRPDRQRRSDKRNPTDSTSSAETPAGSDDSVVHFPFKSARVVEQQSKLLNLYQKKASSSECSKNAVAQLQTKCSSLGDDEELRSRLALSFTFCTLEADKKFEAKAIKQCLASGGGNIVKCVNELNDSLYQIYVQFRVQAESMCHHFQEGLFHERTANVVNALQLAGSTAAVHLGKLASASQVLQDGVSQVRAQQHLATQSMDQLRQNLENAVELEEKHRQHMKSEMKKLDLIGGTIDSLQAKQTDFQISQDEFAALFQRQATRQQESLTKLRDVTNLVRTDVTAASETTATLLLSQKNASEQMIQMTDTLANVASLQSNMFNEVSDVYKKIQDAYKISNDKLTKQLDLIQDASVSARALAESAKEQRVSLLASNEIIKDMLDNIKSYQHRIAVCLFAIEAIVLYLAALCFSLIITTVVGRLSGARGLSTLLILGAYCVEFHILQRHCDELLKFVSWFNPTEFSETLLIDIGRRYLRICFAILLLVYWLWTMVTYMSPEDRHRMVIQDVMGNVIDQKAQEMRTIFTSPKAESPAERTPFVRSPGNEAAVIGKCFSDAAIKMCVSKVPVNEAGHVPWAEVKKLYDEARGNNPSLEEMSRDQLRDRYHRLKNANPPAAGDQENVAS